MVNVLDKQDIYRITTPTSVKSLALDTDIITSQGQHTSMAQGTPEGTITSLPVRKGKGAPDTFKGDFRDIEIFLDHLKLYVQRRMLSRMSKSARDWLGIVSEK